jgi:hypothetical protein
MVAEGPMGFLDIFKRKPPIQDAAAVRLFIDENAAFIVQKGIYEYSRARAGHYAKVLFREPGFQAAVEVSRWRAYPIGLVMVTEMVEGVLRAGMADRHAALDALSAIALRIFDHYPVSPALGDETWRDLRAELTRQLALIGLHPPKRVIDIPEQWAQTYFDLMPIHEKLRTRDFPTTRNYLRVTLCNIHDELVPRLDMPAVARSLVHSRVA